MIKCRPSQNGELHRKLELLDNEPLAREMPLHQTSVLDLFAELILRRELHAACGLFGRDVASVALKLDLDRSELPIEARRVEEWMDASTRAELTAMWRFAIDEASNASEGDDRELTLMIDVLSGFLTFHAKKSEKHLFFFGEIVGGPAKLVQLPSLVDLAPAVEWFLCRDLAEFRP